MSTPSTIDPAVARAHARMDDHTARIAVLKGGMSAERAVSLKSGKAVSAALRARGWDVVEIDVQPDLPAKLVEANPDIAWLALHGPFGEDGCVQGLLEIMRIPYTGSNVRGSAIAMDKVATKRMLRGAGVRLPEDTVWTLGDDIPDDLTFPVIAKTPRGGSTIGIQRVTDAGQLEGALVSLSEMDPTVLIEQLIVGDEVTVAVLDGNDLPLVAIRPVAREGFFDFEAKYTEGKTEYIVPAPISEAAAEDARRQARIAWNTLGLSGVARADFIIDADQNAWFLEVNTLPGMTATSLSPMAAGERGIDFGALVEHIARTATLHVQRAHERNTLEPGGTSTNTAL